MVTKSHNPKNRGGSDSNCIILVEYQESCNEHAYIKKLKFYSKCRFYQYFRKLMICNVKKSNDKNYFLK